MKTKILGLVIVMIYISFACSDENATPDNRNWAGTFQELCAYNRTKVSVREGFYGTLIQVEGNCMPIIDENSTCNNFPVKRKIRIYESTKSEQVDFIQDGYGRFYSGVKTRLVMTIESDDDGFFEAALSPGKYSVFIEDAGKLYANMYDSEGYINSVIVTSSDVSEKNMRLDYAYY